MRRLFNTLCALGLSFAFTASAFAQEEAAALTMDERISAAVTPFVSPIVNTVFFSVPLFGVAVG